MTDPVRPSRLGQWLRRHSLTLVATLGGATGVAFAVARYAPSSSPPAAIASPGTGTLAGGPGPIALAEPVRDTVVDTVQIALILDTSSSMDGLINQARSHLWKMVDDLGRMTRVVDGKVRGVRVEIALYEYGNSSVPATDGYIRQVLPLSGDLDLVSEKLHGLFTNGGSEYAGQAIVTAVTSLEWSSDPSALRFVFLAGNESFDQGPISAAAAMKQAGDKDITVQLIHAGGEEPSWRAAAVLAQSDLLMIDQNHVAQHIPAPQDDEILRIGAALNGTYLAFGAEGQVAMARQASADASSARLSKKVALERSQLKGKASYKNDRWDLVDARKSDKAILEKTKDADLPAELRGKTLAEKQAFVDAKARERADLQAQLARLEAERAKFLEAERAKQGEAEASSLESEVTKSTRKAAAKKGYKL